MEYLYLKTNDGDPQTCDCCEWEAPLAFFRGIPFAEPDRWLCEVCSSTTISRLTITQPTSAEQYQQQQVYQTMAEVANLLLDKITGRKP